MIKKTFLSMIVLLIGLLTLSVVTVVNAQDSEPVARISYYLAPDANGVQQVYQVALNTQREPRQITHAQSDIVTFSAAYDGLGVAYISQGQLWLQPIHTEEPEALTSVSATRFFSSPVWSQDGQYVAYADNGVSLFDLGTRETRQLLANVELDPSASNASQFRIYQPEMFVLGADGTAMLIVDIGIWEWNTTGVYDLASNTLQELGGQLHTSLLPLSDGRVLLYGNSAVAGESALHIADSLTDINTYTEALTFRSLTDATLFAQQAVEIEPGIVRVFGAAIGVVPQTEVSFYFDYDLQQETAGGVSFLNLSEGGLGNTVPGTLSPDGSVIPVYLNALWTDAGSIYGNFKLFDIATGQTVAAQFPETVSVFRWQPSLP